MDETTADRLADCVGRHVQRVLLRDGEVHIPHLGTFSVRREPASVEQEDDGTITLHPPQHSLHFTPDE